MPTKEERQQAIEKFRQSDEFKAFKQKLGDEELEKQLSNIEEGKSNDPDDQEDGDNTETTDQDDVEDTEDEEEDQNQDQDKNQGKERVREKTNVEQIQDQINEMKSSKAYQEAGKEKKAIMDENFKNALIEAQKLDDKKARDDEIQKEKEKKEKEEKDDRDGPEF